MKTAFLDELAQRRSDIGQRWRAALHESPGFTALGNPDTLAFMIDPTLDRLFALGRSRTLLPWSPQSPPAARLVDPATRCALNPLIVYYLCGESALVGVTRSIRPRDGLNETDILTSESELLMLLREVGHDDIVGFCEICRIEAPAAVMTRHCASLPQECPFKAGARGHEKKPAS